MVNRHIRKLHALIQIITRLVNTAKSTWVILYTYESWLISYLFQNKTKTTNYRHSLQIYFTILEKTMFTYINKIPHNAITLH